MSSEETDDTSEREQPRVDLVSILRDLGLDRARLALWTITLGILIGLWFFFWDFTQILILGLFIYYVTRPLFERIHTRIENRTVAVAVSIVAVALPVLLILGWTLTILFQVIADFLSPETQAQFEEFVTPYLEILAATEGGDNIIELLVTDPIQFFQTDLGVLVTQVLEGLLASLGVIASIGLEGFIVLVIVFYLLRDDYRIAAWARRTFARKGGIVETYLVAVDLDLKNVFFGNILNALFTGLIAVVTYLLLNTIAPSVVTIPQAAFVGVLVGVASLVPVVGIKLVTWPIGAFLIARSLLIDPNTIWFPVLFFIVSFVVVDYIPDQLLRPYVSGRGIHVGVIMLAYLFGPLLFGWYGIFMGPFLVVLVFEFGRIVVPWLVSPEEEMPHIPEFLDEQGSGEEMRDEGGNVKEGGQTGEGGQVGGRGRESEGGQTGEGGPAEESSTPSDRESSTREGFDDDSGTNEGQTRDE